jgi:predicted metal-dependent hydrolase
MLPRAALTLDGRRVRYTLRRSPRARRVSGWIRSETGLVVTLPPRGSLEQAEAFLRTHQRWVLRQIGRLSAHAEARPRPWLYGERLLYRGASHRVAVRRARSGSVERAPGRLIVRAPSASIAGARQVLQRWLKREAASALGERVEALGALMGLQAKHLYYVRNLRWSWGRCWLGGALSFNYRLIMAPPDVLDYVVIHELAHLRERGHSPRFWSLVSRHFPDHRRARAWLRTFGGWLGV